MRPPPCVAWRLCVTKPTILIVLLVLLGSESARAAPGDPADEYDARRATIIDDNANWSFVLGSREINHYEFAKTYAALAGETVPDEVRKLYEPDHPRSTAVVAGGWVLGGSLTALGGVLFLRNLFLAMFCSSDACVDSHRGDPPDNSAGVAFYSGLAVMGGTGLYMIATRSPRSADEPYCSRAEAEDLVVAYNRLLARKLGVDDPSRDEQPDRPVKTPQEPVPSAAAATTPELLWGLAPAGVVFSLRF